MTKKAERKPKLTDEERLERFKDMAREVDASEKAESFDEAFERVARSDPN